MSYTLDLYFEPAAEWRRIREYFTARKHFTIVENDFIYRNPKTDVAFSFQFRPTRSILFRRTVRHGEFEVNFFRPSYFGIEAEIELSAFMAAFRPRIHDPQIRGMAEGPYSGEGFLSGWNAGNLLSVRAALSRNPGLKIASMAADTLRAAWAWNYRNATRSDTPSDLQFVPTIMLFALEGRPRTLVVWPLGMPISLPRVDCVLVGWNVSGEKRFGLALWSEVLDIVRSAGFDTGNDPIDLRYFVTPPPIAKWVAAMPEFDLDALERLFGDQILDDEIIAAAAREPIELAERGIP